MLGVHALCAVALFLAGNEHELDLRRRLGAKKKDLPLKVQATGRYSQGKCFDNPGGLRIMFIKSKKVGGSTLAGIFRGLAAARGMEVLYPVSEHEWQRQRNTTCFDLAANHAKRKRWLDVALPGSLKFTIVRHPWGRALSGFYHSRRGGPKMPSLCGGIVNAHCNEVEPSCRRKNDRVRVQWALSCNSHHDGIYDWIRLDKVGDPTPASVVDDYDLVLVTERFDESLMVLKQMLNLTFDELLYIRAKSYPDNYTFNGTHRYLHHLSQQQKSPLLTFLRTSPVPGHAGDPSLPATTRPVEEPEAFKEAVMAKNVQDQAIFHEANKILDQKINAIGRSKIMKDLETFQKIQEEVANVCSDTDRAREILDDKTYDPWRDCYWRDNGCAIRCLKKISNSLNT